MKTLWLASTALIITTGIAGAQSTQTASPAPNGVISAPQTTSSTVSPGKTAQAPSDGTVVGVPSTPAPGTSASPAPTGIASAPAMTTGAPGISPGKTASSPATSEASMSPDSMPMHHHWSSHQWSSTGTLPQDASATTYLHIAKSAIGHHNVTLADDALTHAETDLLNRSVPQGSITADTSPPVQSIENARQALHAGNYSQASSDTKQAAMAVSGM